MERYKNLSYFYCNILAILEYVQRPIAFITCIVEHLMAEGVTGSRLQSAPHDDYRPLEKGRTGRERQW